MEIIEPRRRSRDERFHTTTTKHTSHTAFNGKSYWLPVSSLDDIAKLTHLVEQVDPDITMIMLADWHPDLANSSSRKCRFHGFFALLLEHTEDEMIEERSQMKKLKIQTAYSPESSVKVLLTIEQFLDSVGLIEAILKST